MRVIPFAMGGNCISQNIMKTLLCVYLLEFATVFASSTFIFPKRSPSGLHNVQVEAFQSIARSTNIFGMQIWNKLPMSQNAFISPISISMLLGILYNGARNNSAAQIRQVMRYPPGVNQGFSQILDAIKPVEGRVNPIGYTLEIANAMLVDTAFDIRQSYKEECRKYYDAAVETISFSLHPKEAVESVNGWVSWKTRNKISDVLEEPLDSATQLLLMNAVYFKGTWMRKFDQRFTMPDTFYNEGLVPKTVPMMRQKMNLKYGFDTDLEAHALEIPFEGDNIYMLILLPEKRYGLYDMENKLTSYRLSLISSALRNVMVQVTLPRFRLSEEYDLIPLLRSMGINAVFDPDLAQLEGISRKPGLHVTKAVHKGAVEVNEEGSLAAAVTSVSAGVRTGGPSVTLFNADHPFMFFIRDSRMNLTLFIGRVMKV